MSKHPRKAEKVSATGSSCCPDDINFIFASNRWYDERTPSDRRPPYDDYYRDRPPFPEDPPMHDSAGYPPHPEEVGQQSEPLRVEKKPETVPVESIVDSPGRESRPDRVSMKFSNKLPGHLFQILNYVQGGTYKIFPNLGHMVIYFFNTVHEYMCTLYNICT